MPDHDMSPIPDSSQPQREGYSRAEDDIELPPMPESEGVGPSAAGWSNDKGGGKSKGFSSLLGAAVLIGAVVVGGWYMMRTGAAEKEHPNWPHVAAAADASDSDASQLLHLDAAGNSQVLPAIELSAADLDRPTTRQIRFPTEELTWTHWTSRTKSGFSRCSLSAVKARLALSRKRR